MTSEHLNKNAFFIIQNSNLQLRSFSSKGNFPRDTYSLPIHLLNAIFVLNTRPNNFL